MLKPADLPREALLSKNGEVLRLVREPIEASSQNLSAKVGNQNDWVTGRPGMMYRDLIPDRLGGRLIASHIRLTKGGPVPDYVHYHKVDFQMIYCLRGRIKVVYEDQGPPFWLEPGDCVLQPPEIRHRVLECEAGSEVIEVSSPAEHETWVEHKLELPDAVVNPDRDFSGQRFVRHVAANATWTLGSDGQPDSQSTGMSNVTVLRNRSDQKIEIRYEPGTVKLLFPLDKTTPGATVLDGHHDNAYILEPNTRALCVVPALRNAD